MNTLAWIAQVILFVAFLYSGICKTGFSKAEVISRGQTGVVNLSQFQIRLIGMSEILGAIGIIVPWWLGIMPVLTPVAATCFTIVMLLAAPIHYKLGELRNVATNIFLLALSVFAAWMRFRHSI
ncbi:MAG TPA: DoxX family protein [Puia sp.]|nr:DoxX family protein [Puia sp.]